VRELSVAVDMLPAFLGLALALHTVTGGLEQASHGARAYDKNKSDTGPSCLPL
jgi:hypothetical protein